MSALAQPVLPPRRRAPSLRDNLRFGVIDGVLYSYMVGAGESVLALFVIAAGFPEVAAGLVQTVPFLLGAIIQLGAPWAVQRIGRLRRYVVLASTLQAMSLVPLGLMAAAGRPALWAIFLFAMLYWAASMGCGAGWSTWIGMIVPRRLRPRYFAYKSRFGAVATLTGLAGGGLLLERFTDGDQRLWPYAALFFSAAAARAGCSYFLQRQSDTGPVPSGHRSVAPLELLRRLRAGPDGRFMLYLMLVQVAVQIGQPFYAPFMKAQLALSYHEILTLIGAAFIAKAATQHFWGAFAHRFGARRLLWVGGLGIIPHSALWLVSPSFGYLLPMQLFAGSMWAAFELATLLMMFESLREEERTSLWSIYNVMNASAMVTGSLLGAAVLRADPGWPGYQAIFLLSFAARLGTLLYLRARPIAHPEPIRVEVEAVRPGAGSIDRPI